jgi:hypothetical protein
MDGLTKEKAKQVDDLLIQIHNAKPRGNSELLNVMHVSQSMESLKDKDYNYIQGPFVFR